MNIDYELAKRLKDAGFPNLQGKPDDYLLDYAEAITLSELIEACGNGFRTLGKSQIEPFYATGYRASTNDNLTIGGSTPEEAVANLWLALNEPAEQLRKEV